MNIYGISAHPILTVHTTSMFFISPSSSTLSLLIYQRQGERGTRQHVKKLASLSPSVGSLRTSRESSVGSNSSSSSIQQPKREKGNEIRLTMREADDERFLKYSNDRKEGGADPKRFSVNLEWIKEPSVLKEVYQIYLTVY